MNILHLNLKRKWFEMILSGEKKEEYRDLTLYWEKRLCIIPDFGDIFKQFDIVRFRNGYQKDSPAIDIEFEGIELRTGKPEWGAEPGKDYFVIKLGDVIKDDKYFDALGNLGLLPVQ